MNNNSDTQVWIRFFKDALIPSQFIQVYANKFTENRIRFDMLADLDRLLLNEMGITAIGDCLSILKHAKTIISQIEEKNKLELKVATNSNSNDLNAKKRSEVAKRIIETYLSDPEAKPLNETKTITSSSSNSSSLSADLISRLNFNQTKLADDQSQTSITKVIVSSTTNDDEQNRNKLKPKRKIDDVYEINNTIVLNKNKKEPALEYRGLLKNESLTITADSINDNPKRTSSFVNNNNDNNKHKSLKTTNTTLSSGGFQFENFKIETKNENVTAKTAAASFTNKKLFDRIGTLKSDSMTTKNSTSNNKAVKTKIIPITFEKTITNTNTNTIKSSNDNDKKSLVRNNSIFDRLY